ncbi:MAG: hypothetical protein AABZ08_03675 [Planctomycetota bacterium]
MSHTRTISRLLPRLSLVGAMTLALTGCPAPKTEEPTIRERSRVSIVRDRPGDVRVDGIGALRGFAKGRDCTFMHCLELVLEATGRKIGYDELMGLSGMAFRTQFRTDRWDVGNPDPLAGESVLDVLFPAIGWDYDLRIVKQEDYAEKDALYRAVSKSIDAGFPVLAANIIPPEDWGLIVGYRGSRTWLCRSYNGDAEASDKSATGWPTATLFLTNRKSRPEVRKAHLESIRRAVELFDRKASGQNVLGRKALEAWTEALRSPKDRSYIHANFWTYVSLIDARGAAVRYLRMIAKEFGTRDLHLGMAADYYDSEVRVLLQGMNNVPAEHTFPVGLPPAEYRAKQIETLRQALALEEKAIESLKKAQ